MHCLKIPHAHGKRPWVARILGLSSTYGLDREFVPTLHDYNALGLSTNEIMCCFFMEPGEVYEVCENPAKISRYYCRVVKGDELEKIPLDEVMAALKIIKLEKAMDKQIAQNKFAYKVV